MGLTSAFLSIVLLPRPPATAIEPPARVATEEERLSLEEWLERLRARRDARRALLRDELAVLLADLDRVIEDPSSNAVHALTERIIELGDEVAPLLVEHLDPGAEPRRAVRARAELMAKVLSRLDATSIEGPLIELLNTGGPDASAHAAHVLARASGSRRAGEALLAAFERSTGQPRKVYLQALLEVSGPARERVLDEVLGGDDEETIDQALHALADSPNVGFKPAVREILDDPERSVRHARALLAFFVACGAEHVEDDELAGLIDLARRASVAPRHRIAILSDLRKLAERLSHDLRREVEPLAEHTHPEIREAALTTLAYFGDRSSRRRLLEPYDERIDDNPEWALRWADRAAVHYAIGDYRDAIQDWKKALQVARDDPAPPRGVHVGLARAYAQQGRLRDAAEWLDEAPITTDELRALADEPVFAELRADDRYGKVFRL